MAIDENIYGDSTEWEDYWHGMCKCTDYTLWSKVESGDWELNELIDNSVCYFGAIGNFYGANPIAFLPNNEQCRVFEEQEVSNMVFLLQDSSSTEGWKYDYFGITGTINKWSEWDNISDMPDYSPQTRIKTMFNFKLNKLLFIPYVRATATDDVVPYSSYYFTLADWIANSHTTYPYLCSVHMIPYYNYGTDESPEWVSASVNTDHYVFTQRNAFFSEEFKDVGDGDVTATYYLGGVPTQRQYIMIMGCRDSWHEISTEKPMGFDPDISHYSFNDDFTKVRYCREYSEDLIKEIYSQIAFYGVFFLGSGADSFYNVSLTSDRVYLGIIEDGGYTRGNYTHGSDNANQPQYTWEDTSESEYDPNATPDTPDNWKIDFPSHLGTKQHNVLNHWYIFDENDIGGAFFAINDVDLSSLDMNMTYGMNPIDGVLQTRRVYFNAATAKAVLNTGTGDAFLIGTLLLPLPYDPGSGTPRQIYAHAVTYNEIYDFDCGDIDVVEPSDMKDFRAYTPFTSAIFYDAFCGIIEIDPSKFLNKNLKVVQTVDFLTGDKITSLYAKPIGATDTEYCRIATVQGNCAEELPVNGLATSDYQRNKYMLTGQMALQAIGTFGRATMGAAGATISSVSNNPAGAALQGVGTLMNTISGAVSINMMQHEYAHLIPSAVKVSNGSSNVESGVVFPPMIIMFNPKMVEEYNQEQYKLLTGFAGYKVDTLENCGVGTHIVSHPKLDIPCTSSELYTIYDQLQKGIFVKEEPEPTPNE